MRTGSLLVTGLVASLLVSARARAGVTITVQRGADAPSTVYVEGDRMRMDTPERMEAGQNMHVSAIILDGPAKRMIMLDDKNKTWSEMTEEDRKRIRAQVEAMRAQMQERLKSMPPDQRKRMEEMMGPLEGGDAKPRDWKFEATGQKKSVNGMACQMYRVTEDGKLLEQQCVSPWSAGLVKKTDFAGVAKISQEMFQGMTGGAGAARGGGANMLAQIQKAPGIPISRVPMHADGTPGEEEQIKSIKRGGVSASMFAVPSGYAKKDLPMGMGEMGPGGRLNGPPPRP